MLTEVAVRKLAPPETGRLEVPDGKVQGLFLRVSAGGRKTWVFRRFRKDLGRLRLTFGTYPEVSLANARAKAMEVSSVLVAGGDPRQRSKAAATVADLMEEFLTRHAEPRLKEKTVREYRRIVERDIVPVLGAVPAARLTRQQTGAYLARVAKRGASMRNRVKEVLSSAYGWAIDAGWDVNNPCYGLRKLAEGRRRRTLSDLEIQSLWQDLLAYLGPAGGALQLLLLTGQRSGEVRSLKWTDLRIETRDAIAGTWWALPETKTGRSHLVFLGELALEVLERERGRGEVYVFEPNTSPGNQLGEWSLRQAAARIQAKGSWAEPWSPHDLRRTVDTGLARLGVDAVVADRVLNHAQPGVRARYNVWDYAPERRAALLTWERHLRGLLEAAPSRA